MPRCSARQAVNQEKACTVMDSIPVPDATEVGAVSFRSFAGPSDYAAIVAVHPARQERDGIARALLTHGLQSLRERRVTMSRRKTPATESWTAYASPIAIGRRSSTAAWSVRGRNRDWLREA